MVETETSNSPNVVILDSGAQLSIFNNKDLLQDLHESDITININRINKSSPSIATNTVGYLCGLEKIEIYYSPLVKRNILSFNDVNKCYDVMWNPINSSFNVNTGVNQYSFTNISNVFCRTFVPSETLLTTVKENWKELPIPDNIICYLDEQSNWNS